MIGAHCEGKRLLVRQKKSLQVTPYEMAAMCSLLASAVRKCGSER